MRRSRPSGSLDVLPQYASVALRAAALHLELFEQPEGFFSKFLEEPVHPIDLGAEETRMPDTTPLMKQYQEIKERYREAILFFRLGDFYEMFSEDAIVASKILGITLTSRDKSKSDPIPLCGVPYHAATGYIAKLIRAGYNVAICEQMEDPQTAKGIVHREVVRVITPGTLLEDELLNAKENNYLAAIVSAPQSFGLSFLDLSTGSFRLTQFEGVEARFRLENELARLAPTEILFSESATPEINLFLEALPFSVHLNPRAAVHFAHDRSYRLLLDHFKVHSLEGFGCQDKPWGVSAAGALLQYLRETRLPSLDHLQVLRVYTTESHMILDSLTQRNLELTRGLVDGKKESSLLGVLDRTLTPMGARILKGWLLHALLDIGEIEQRQEVVSEFAENLSLRSQVRKELKEIADLERLISRISLKMANARDLVALKSSLQCLPALYQTLHSAQAPLLQSFVKAWDSLDTLVLCIEKAIVDSPPITLKEGGLIREGYHPLLEELRTVSREGKGWIAKIEQEERKRTGIDSLKVRYNQVFGYYIEVTKSNLPRIPSDYIRKQTLVNAERFITPGLKELEAKVLGAEERIRALEYELFEEVREQVARETTRVQAMAQVIAQIDVLSSLAEAAVRYHYVRPQVTLGPILEIGEGRHPVLEQFVPAQRFVPNDTLLDDQSQRLLIITGPNMAGKSTYMRQVALITLMAQMGSFVPARSATMGIVDRIFTRVGASDNLIAGQSTFMTEMSETANILHNATPRSLILLDEIGRGTSTFDGLSIAWAVAEYLVDRNRGGPRTLFATHYHELMELAITHAGVKNYTSLVREWNDEIIFLRKITAGGSDKSYGIHVARLAGLPQAVIERAREILANLEMGELNAEGRPRLAQSLQERGNSIGQRDLFGSLVSPANDRLEHFLIQELLSIDPLQMTPLQALAKLDELKKKAQETMQNPQKEVP